MSNDRLDATESNRMAQCIRRVVNAIYEGCGQLAKPSQDSMAQADRDNTELGRSGLPWGSVPVETYQSMLGFTAVALADHLHATSQLLLDDIDFGPMVMARSTVEAAGRIEWLLPLNDEAQLTENLRSRVGRGLGLRVRGLRDNARNLSALAAVEDPPRPEVLKAAQDAEARVKEVLTLAHRLKYKTHPNTGTNEHEGLMGLREPTGDELTSEALSHLAVPVTASFFGLWSAIAHSTYDALRSHLEIRTGAQTLGRPNTTVAARPWLRAWQPARQSTLLMRSSSISASTPRHD